MLTLKLVRASALSLSWLVDWQEDDEEENQSDATRPDDEEAGDQKSHADEQQAAPIDSVSVLDEDAESAMDTEENVPPVSCMHTS